jgi:hypothetical protein
MKTHILDVAATENNDNDDGNLRAPFLHPSLRFSLISIGKCFSDVHERDCFGKIEKGSFSYGDS